MPIRVVVWPKGGKRTVTFLCLVLRSEIKFATELTTNFKSSVRIGLTSVIISNLLNNSIHSLSSSSRTTWFAFNSIAYLTILL